MIAAPISAAGRVGALVPPPAVAALGAPGASTAQPAPNPSSRLDLTLGITVLTFHDASGQVIATTPTQQQLSTYLLFGSSRQADAGPVGGTQGGAGVATLA